MSRDLTPCDRVLILKKGRVLSVPKKGNKKKSVFVLVVKKCSMKVDGSATTVLIVMIQGKTEKKCNAGTWGDK